MDGLRLAGMPVLAALLPLARLASRFAQSSPKVIGCSAKTSKTRSHGLHTLDVVADDLRDDKEVPQFNVNRRLKSQEFLRLRTRSIDRRSISLVHLLDKNVI